VTEILLLLVFRMAVAAESPERHSRKRARTTTGIGGDVQSNEVARQPGLYAPFRALGLVTNSIPFALQTRSFKGASDAPRVHILTCLGRSWALWDGAKMTLLFAGAFIASMLVPCCMLTLWLHQDLMLERPFHVLRSTRMRYGRQLDTLLSNTFEERRLVKSASSWFYIECFV
jgi:hypothetical protein